MADAVTVSFNPSELLSFQAALTALSGKQMQDALRRAINSVGDRDRTQVKRVLTKQTGLKAHVIERALKTKRANFDELSYTMTVRGGNVAMKYFGARETLPGVSAAPLGQRQVFVSTFMKGGKFPDRVPLKLGGQVFERTGAGREIRKVLSGVYIPLELVSGATVATFQKTAEQMLPGRVAHEIDVITRGIVA